MFIYLCATYEIPPCGLATSLSFGNDQLASLWFGSEVLPSHFPSNLSDRKVWNTCPLWDWKWKMNLNKYRFQDKKTTIPSIFLTLASLPDNPTLSCLHPLISSGSLLLHLPCSVSQTPSSVGLHHRRRPSYCSPLLTFNCPNTNYINITSRRNNWPRRPKIWTFSPNFLNRLFTTISFGDWSLYETGNRPPSLVWWWEFEQRLTPVLYGFSSLIPPKYLISDFSEKFQNE